jgi:hypothetical protein
VRGSVCPGLVHFCRSSAWAIAALLLLFSSAEWEFPYESHESSSSCNKSSHASGVFSFSAVLFSESTTVRCLAIPWKNSSVNFLRPGEVRNLEDLSSEPIRLAEHLSEIGGVTESSLVLHQGAPRFHENEWNHGVENHLKGDCPDKGQEGESSQRNFMGSAKDDSIQSQQLSLRCNGERQKNRNDA